MTNHEKLAELLKTKGGYKLMATSGARKGQALSKAPKSRKEALKQEYAILMSKKRRGEIGKKKVQTEMKNTAESAYKKQAFIDPFGAAIGYLSSDKDKGLRGAMAGSIGGTLGGSAGLVGGGLLGHLLTPNPSKIYPPFSTHGKKTSPANSKKLRNKVMAILLGSLLGSGIGEAGGAYGASKLFAGKKKTLLETISDKLKNFIS